MIFNLLGVSQSEYIYIYGGGIMKPVPFFENFPTFATTNHQPPTPDDNKWVTKIARESSV